MRGAADRGAELDRRQVPVVDPDPLAERDQVRRQVGAGPQAVVGQDRGDHPRRRGLAVGADDVDRRESALGMPERGHQPPHPVQPEPHPEQLQRQQIALGLALVHGAAAPGAFGHVVITPVTAPPARLAAAPACRARPAPPAAGALATKPWLASLRSARSISASSLRAALLNPALGRPRGRRSAPAKICTCAAGDRHRGHRLRAVGGGAEVQPGQAADVPERSRRSRAPPAGRRARRRPRSPPGSRQRRSSWTAAMARCDRRLGPASPTTAPAAPPTAAPASSPSAPGMCE